MKERQLEQANDSWSRRVGSVAIAATSAFPELRAGNADPYGALQDESHYYRAIDHVLGVGGKRKNPIRSLLNAALMKSSPLQNLGVKFYEQMAIQAEPEKVRKHYESFESNFTDHAAPVIRDLATSETDQRIREDLGQVAEGLDNNDPRLKLKISLDGLRASFEELGLQKGYQQRLFAKTTDAMIPELQHQDPAAITPDLLFELQTYGLMEYVDLSRHVRPLLVTQQDVGNPYRMDMSFMGRPKPDDVSGISSRERMPTWEREANEYNTQRIQVVEHLSTLEAHKNDTTDKEFFSGYNKTWVATNLDMVGEILGTVLDNDVTSRIIESSEPTGKRPIVDLFMRSPRTSARYINGQRSAIESIYVHTKDFPTEDNMNLLLSALTSFRSLTMGLYDLA